VALYVEAFRRRPTLAVAPGNGHRHEAAGCAALAGCGKSKDVLTAAELLALRRRALTWLHAELKARASQLTGGQAEQRPQAPAALRHWQSDPDLAGLRDAEALKALSTEERQACERLWADVATVLKEAAEKRPPPLSSRGG
jgi:hypothetical protein